MERAALSRIGCRGAKLSRISFCCRVESVSPPSSFSPVSSPNVPRETPPRSDSVKPSGERAAAALPPPDELSTAVPKRTMLSMRRRAWGGARSNGADACSSPARET